MNKLTKFVGAAILTVGLSSAAMAASISGQIGIGLFGQNATVTVNNATDAVTFSAGPNAIVGSTLGNYDIVFGSTATYSNFNYGVGFTPGVVWTVNATTNFTLNSISSFDETLLGGVTVTGLGVATLTGFTATPGSWSFSADRATSAALFTFSSTAIVPPPTVPEGGTTAALLGLSLVGLGFIARRRRA